MKWSAENLCYDKLTKFFNATKAQKLKIPLNFCEVSWFSVLWQEKTILRNISYQIKYARLLPNESILKDKNLNIAAVEEIFPEFVNPSSKE